jgi:hypothetical protein
MRLKKLFGALSLFSACGLAAVTLGGCAEDRTTLFIHHVYAFSPGDCEISPSLDGTQLGSGQFDPSFGTAYSAVLVIANGLQPLGDNDTLRPETSRIQLEGAEISVTSAGGGAGLPAFTSPFTITIDPVDGEDPGVVAGSVPLIPPASGIADGLYTINIVVFGRTLGGKKVESPEFGFPIQVLSGSAFYCGPAADVEDLMHPCGLPQDGFVAASCDPSVDVCSCAP